MSIFNDKALKSVAEAASKIMSEKLHPNQQKLDVHEPEKDKLTADDFKKLRAMKKEETQQVKEGWDDMLKAVADRTKPQPSGGAGIKKGRAYGGSAQKENEYEAEQKKEMKKKKKFNEMVEILKSKGLKGINEAFEKEEVLSEEPDNEQFTKELEVQKRKASGTAPDSEKAKVAEPAVQAVEVQKEQTHNEVQVVDLTDPDNITVETKSLEERSLTEPEMKKREEIVKSMKKGLKGFKERYGERAKEVMYATATARAKGD